MTEPRRPSHLLAVLGAAALATTIAAAPAASASAAPAGVTTHAVTKSDGLRPVAQRARAAIADRFGLGNIGGYRAGGSKSDHSRGLAIDVMVRGERGDRVASWVQDNAGRLDVKYVIWKQRYWQPGMNGWRHMEDRGGATANHFDHVHISFEG